MSDGTVAINHWSALGFAFGTTNRYNPDLTWPVSNEYAIELQRQFAGNIVVSTGYTRRETRRNIGPTNVAVPASSYIPLSVREVNSGQTITVYNQAPTLRGRFDTLWDNGWDDDRIHRGVAGNEQRGPGVGIPLGGRRRRRALRPAARGGRR